MHVKITFIAFNFFKGTRGVGDGSVQCAGGRGGCMGDVVVRGWHVQSDEDICL